MSKKRKKKETFLKPYKVLFCDFDDLWTFFGIFRSGGDFNEKSKNTKYSKRSQAFRKEFDYKA